MRKKRTKNRNIRSRNKHRKNKKRTHVKSKNKKRKNTKRKNPIREQRAGMERFGRCLGCVTGPPQPTPENFEPEPEPDPELESDDHTPESGESPISLVDKFFTVESDAGGDKYKLKGDLQVISAHGAVQNAYTVVPEGITLYFFAGAGEIERGYGESSRWAARLVLQREAKKADKNQYVSVYRPGSLIQQQGLDFYPFYGDPLALGGSVVYSPVGLLKYKLRKGGRDYTDGFTCGDDCQEKVMNYLRGSVRDIAREIDLQRIKEGKLWDQLGTLARDRLIQFADDPKNGIPNLKREVDFAMSVIPYTKLTTHKIKKHVISHYQYDKTMKYDELLEYIEKHLDIFYDDNIDKIYTKKELFKRSKFFPRARRARPFHLSMVLNRIAEVMKTDDSISGDWFGHFCRKGEVLDITTLQACNEKYFEPLPDDFFNEDIQFEGVGELRRQDSLASKSETVNFKGTVDALQGYCQGLGAVTEIPGLLSRWGRLGMVGTATIEVKDKLRDIHTRLSNGEPVSLTPEEVCFIFQLKYHLQKQGISF